MKSNNAFIFNTHICRYMLRYFIYVYTYFYKACGTSQHYQQSRNNNSWTRNNNNKLMEIVKNCENSHESCPVNCPPVCIKIIAAFK